MIYVTFGHTLVHATKGIYHISPRDRLFSRRAISKPMQICGVILVGLC